MLSDDKFLAVPGTRSRGNSIETPSSEGDVTLVPGQRVISGTATAGKSLHEDEDPLRPYKPDDPEFIVEDNTFAFTPGQLGRLYMPKNHAALKALGGLRGLEIGLRTDRRAGLSLDETSLDGRVTFEQAVNHQASDGGEPGSREAPLAPTATNGTARVGDLKSDAHKERKRVFKDNRLPVKKTKNIFQLMWIAFLDKVLLLLSGAAGISLALGLYQTFGGQHKEGEGAKVDWVEGVAIMVAIIIVVVVGAGNDYQKERQFVKLNKKVKSPFFASRGLVRIPLTRRFVACRKKIALLKLYDLADLSRSLFMTFSLATFVIWNLVISSPRMVSLYQATISRPTSPLLLVNRIK